MAITEYISYEQIEESDDGNFVTKNYLAKLVADGGLKIYRELVDSDDAGMLYLNQGTSPYHTDSDTGVTDSNGMGDTFNVIEVLEYNRPWDSDGEAIAYGRNQI